MGECLFWYRPTRVVPDQRPLNGRCCCCTSKGRAGEGGEGKGEPCQHFFSSTLSPDSDSSGVGLCMCWTHYESGIYCFNSYLCVLFVLTRLDLIHLL